MKTIRYLLLFTTAATLIFLCLGTALQLVEFAGLAHSIDLVLQDPGVLVDAYYQSLGEMNLNQRWFGDNGPFVMFGLLVALLVACLP